MANNQQLKIKISSILVIFILIVFAFKIYSRNILNMTGDFGDAPVSYGKPVHYKPEEGPYFGAKRGDNDLKKFSDSCIYDYCNIDDSTGADDEDAFTNNFMVVPSDVKSSVFLPDVEAKEKSYTLNIPVNAAEDGDPVRCWIDFNGNGIFDETEKASAVCHKGKNIVALTWLLNTNLQPCLTYARLRTCKDIFVQQLELPDAAVTTGEVEDYLVRIIKTEAPLTELKNYADLGLLNSTESFDSIITDLNKLTLGNNKLHFNVTGPKPEIIGINNLHEASMYGFRIGHDIVDINKNNPIVTKISFDAAQENFAFKLIDIDGGDRIKIEGFYNGRLINFHVRNLTDNFYYQYNQLEKELYSMEVSDAGNDLNMPSSLDMGAEISFNGLVDSVKLFYSDDSKGSAGTYTLADISARKYRMPEVKIKNLSINEKHDGIAIDWEINNTMHIVSYSIQRSLDGIFYETIQKYAALKTTDNKFQFLDKTLPPNILNCYYRITVAETDNHTVMSNIVRLKRNIATSLSGFTFIDRDFVNELNLVLLTDMPGTSTLNLYDYDGKSVRNYSFSNMKEGNTYSIKNLDSLSEGSYYLEILNSNKKYLVQALK